MDNCLATVCSMAAVRGRKARGHTSGIYLLLYLRKIHQMVMFTMLKTLGPGLVWKMLATAMLLVLLAVSTALFAAAQRAETTPVDHTADPVVDHYYEPLPQQTAAAGPKLLVRAL